MNMKQRDYSFDYLKGVLIFLVVLGHCPAFILSSPELDFDKWCDPIYIYTHTFHMPLFMFTTGYFFSKKKNEKLTVQVPQQAKRLLLPQFSWCVLCLIPIILQFDKFGHFIEGPTIALTVKAVYHYITSYWYLWCTLFCGIIITIAYKTHYPLYIISVLCVLMLIFENHLPDWFFKHQQVIAQLPFFTLGVVCRDMKDLDNKMRTVFVPAFIGYVICWMVFLHIGDSFGDTCSSFKMLWAFFGVLAFYTIFKECYNYNIFRKSIQKWGGYTLGIYIIHTVLNRFVVQGNIGLVVHTGYIMLDYAICIIYSISLTWICVWITDLIRKNKTSKKYLLGESK